mgnify:CR=1 FL=1
MAIYGWNKNTNTKKIKGENDDSKKIPMNKIPMNKTLKIDGPEREQNLEQTQEQKKKFEMKQSFIKGEQYFDLYLDWLKLRRGLYGKRSTTKN